MLRGNSAAIAALLLFLSQSSTAFLAPYRSNTVNCARGADKASSTRVHVFDMFKDAAGAAKKNLVKSLAGEYDESAVRARLDGLVNDNPVLMLSFTTCPFCIKAKETLDAKSAKYTVVELDTDIDGKAIRAEMADFVGRTSVPAIWIDGKFVGGCNDGPMGGLLKLEQDGKLDGLLQAVGAF